MTQNKPRTIEAVVYAYKRVETNGVVTKVDFDACQKIGKRQFRSLDHLRESLEFVQGGPDKEIYLFDFSGQDLSGVNLANIELNGCRFRNCNLEGAELGGCELMGADFTGANLRNANLRNVAAPDKEYVLRNFARTMAQMSLFYDRYDFGPAVFDGADLTGADLLHARLRGVRADGADFTNARLDHADLSAANFINTRFEHAHMFKTDIKDATFTNAPLSKYQLKQSIGNAISHSHHEARRLRRLNRPTP